MVWRAVIRVAGRPVLLRAAAVLAAVGMPSVIIFGGQGLSAHDLLRAMHSSLPVSLVVWGGWTALSAAAATSVFDAPGLTAIRAARPRRTALLPALVLLAAIVQLPWAALWIRGAGIVTGLEAVVTALAMAASAFSLTRRPTLRGALTLAAALVASQVFLPAGLVLGPFAVDLAWRVAPEARSSARVWTRANASPLVALATVHLLRLARLERMRLLLASMIGSIGTAGLLTLRSDPTPRPGGRAVAIMTVPLVVAASLFVTPLLACEASLRARLRVLRVRHAVVLGAFLLAVAAPTSAFAALSGVAMGAPPAPLVGWAFVLSAIVALWGRRHDRMPKRGPGLYAMVVALIALVTVTFAMELM